MNLSNSKAQHNYPFSFLVTTRCRKFLRYQLVYETGNIPDKYAFLYSPSLSLSLCIYTYVYMHIHVYRKPLARRGS